MGASPPRPTPPEEWREMALRPSVGLRTREWDQTPIKTPLCIMVCSIPSRLRSWLGRGAEGEETHLRFVVGVVGESGLARGPANDGRPRARVHPVYALHARHLAGGDRLGKRVYQVEQSFGQIEQVARLEQMNQRAAHAHFAPQQQLIGPGADGLVEIQRTFRGNGRLNGGGQAIS